jgi:PAP2 superfamily C-terminal
VSTANAYKHPLAPKSSFRAQWRAALEHPRFLAFFLATLALCVATWATVVRTLRACETRIGVPLADPVLALLPAVDLSIPIFIIEYGCIAAILYRLTHQPIRLTVALLGYCIAMFFRVLAIILVPLEPPVDLIILVDPFTSVLTSGPVLTKDLFFSGHTTALALLACAAPRGRLKVWLCVLTATIAVMLLIQRNHYTVDVAVAPAVAYIGWRMARHVSHRLLGSPIETA